MDLLDSDMGPKTKKVVVAVGIRITKNNPKYAYTNTIWR